MAFPQVLATNSGQDSTGTSHTVNLPSGIVAGNLLLVCFTHADATTITFPSGWTTVWHQTSGTMTGAGAYRRADGTEGATITVTTGTSSLSGHVSYRLTGHHRTRAPQVALATGTGTTPDPPTLAPTWGLTDTLWLAVMHHDQFTAAPTYPTNYTNGLADTNRHTASAQRELAAASENPGAYTVDTSDDWVAATVAIPPFIPEGRVRPLSLELVGEDDGPWPDLHGRHWFRTPIGVVAPHGL